MFRFAYSFPVLSLFPFSFLLNFVHPSSSGVFPIFDPLIDTPSYLSLVVLVCVQTSLIQSAYII